MIYYDSEKKKKKKKKWTGETTYSEAHQYKFLENKSIESSTLRPSVHSLYLWNCVQL